MEEASKSVITRVPAPMIFILGSVFMCLGMFLCAALVGHSTRESIFLRKSLILDGTDHGHSRLRGRADINLLRNPTPTVSDRVIWTAQSSELEAILGIWLWSLKKVDQLEGSDNYGNRVSLAEKILSLRIIGLPDAITRKRWACGWLAISVCRRPE